MQMHLLCSRASPCPANLSGTPALGAAGKSAYSSPREVTEPGRWPSRRGARTSFDRSGCALASSPRDRASPALTRRSFHFGRAAGHPGIRKRARDRHAVLDARVPLRPRSFGALPPSGKTWSASHSVAFEHHDGLGATAGPRPIHDRNSTHHAFERSKFRTFAHIIPILLHAANSSSAKFRFNALDGENGKVVERVTSCPGA